MRKSELKQKVQQNGSHFFDKESMRFFGDTMKNYGLRKTKIDTRTQKNIKVYELYRKTPVKHGLQRSAYFDIKTLERKFKIRKAEINNQRR